MNDAISVFTPAAKAAASSCDPEIETLPGAAELGGRPLPAVRVSL